MLLQNIPLTQINVADDSFRITFAPDISKLRCSIKEAGVIEPVHVRHTADGSYQIITGYKRVLACKELAKQLIPALIYDHTELAPLAAFLHNLHDNIFCRRLNVIEKATVCAKLDNIFGVNQEEITNKYLPLLGEPRSYKLLYNFLTIDTIIPPMKEHIVNSDIAVCSAARIAEFSPSTQQALLKVLAPIKPNTNKLNELLTLIRDIAARDGITVEDVLQRYELLTIVTNPEVAAPEKIAALRQMLKGVKLPQLSMKQQELPQMIAQLQLPADAKLRADPYFEDPNFRLEYSFGEVKDLDLLVSRLKDALENQKWQRIFEWYRA